MCLFWRAEYFVVVYNSFSHGVTTICTRSVLMSTAQGAEGTQVAELCLVWLAGCVWVEKVWQLESRVVKKLCVQVGHKNSFIRTPTTVFYVIYPIYSVKVDIEQRLKCNHEGFAYFGNQRQIMTRWCLSVWRGQQMSLGWFGVEC